MQISMKKLYIHFRESDLLTRPDKPVWSDKNANQYEEIIYSFQRERSIDSFGLRHFKFVNWSSDDINVNKFKNW